MAGGNKALITQSDATRMLKAAKAAGYANAKIECRHSDGVISLIASDDEFSTLEKNDFDDVLDEKTA